MQHPLARNLPLALIAILLSLTSPFASAEVEPWPPVTAEELSLKSDPNAPKAPAIYLYRQVDRNDRTSNEAFHERIKVLTDEGRKYANIEIPYVRREEAIRDLEARVITPDGTVIPFDGTVYDKPLVKTFDYSMMAKSFTLPNVQVGSIVEYRYRRKNLDEVLYNSRWVLSADLYTRHARFSLVASKLYLLRWSWPRGLPPGTQPPVDEKGTIRLETRAVPAFVSESYMPPEDLMKYRVDFVYEDDDSNQKDEKSYWEAVNKRRYKAVTRFLLYGKNVEQAVATLVQPGDSEEQKARKLYARAQQIRNLSYEKSTTAQERKREDLVPNDSVEEVWKHSYGYVSDINWLFLAMARAAGLEAHPVLVSTRDRYFFDRRHMNARQLNASLVAVKIDGRDVYLNPGVPFVPFGALPWYETGVVGLQLGEKQSTWIRLPLPERADSRVERRASLKLSPAGTLEGKLTVTHTGLDALWIRLGHRDDDEKSRIEYLQNNETWYMAPGSEAKLTNTPDWTSSETPLIAEYDIKVPGWAVGAGKRLVAPIGLFGDAEKTAFTHATRVHPVYFHFPFQHTDEVRIELPPGAQVESTPKPRTEDMNVARYSITAKSEAGVLTISRQMSSSILLIDPKHYPSVRDFFQVMRTGDEDQVVISREAPSPVPVTSVN